MPAIFQPPIAKKINQASSVRVIVISTDHRLLWPDSYKGVGSASKLPESTLHKIIIMSRHTSLEGAWHEGAESGGSSAALECASIFRKNPDCKKNSCAFQISTDVSEVSYQSKLL